LGTRDDIDFVDVQYVDLVGFLRTVTIPYRTYASKKPSYVAAFDGSSVEGFEKINKSDMFLKPDENTFSPIPWDQRRARVLSEIYNYRHERYEKDPRFIAKKTDEYIRSLNFKPLVGAEMEFFILSSIDVDVENKARGIGYYLTSLEQAWDTSGIPLMIKKSYHMAEPSDRIAGIRVKILDALKDMGYGFQASHHEVAVSQSEVSLEAGDPLFIGDEIISFKYIARNIASQNGLSAIFMPKPLYGDNGSGLHFHISLWDCNESKNLFIDEREDEISQVARYFIGGILYHGRSLAAFVAPTTNSYKRLVPGFEAPIYLVWGHSNRTVAIRIPSFSNKGSSARIEFRSPDPSCNPYFAISATLLAGIDGIKKKIDPGDPYEGDIYQATPKELYEKSIRTLPKSLDEALDELESDHEYLKPIFSKYLLESYIEAKRRESNTVRAIPHPYEVYMYSNL